MARMKLQAHTAVLLMIACSPRLQEKQRAKFVANIRGSRVVIRIVQVNKALRFQTAYNDITMHYVALM
jgi:hypothetical protein